MTRGRRIDWQSPAAPTQSCVLHRIVRDDRGAFVDLEVLFQSGSPSEEPRIGERLLEVFPSLRQDPIWEHYRRVVETGVPFRHETRRTSRGIARWYETHVLRGEGADGGCLAVFGQDVTARRRGKDALRILSEAGRSLTSSRELPETLHDLARVLVPELADMCAVTLATHEHLRRISFGIGSAGAVIRFPSPPTADPREGFAGSAKVLRTGRPALVPHVTEDSLREFSGDPVWLAGARAMGIRSLVIVPVRSSGSLVGTLSVGSTRTDRRPYDADDVLLLECVAERVASVIANAHVHEDARLVRKVRDDTLTFVTRDLRRHLGGVLANASALATDADAPELESIRREVAHAEALVSELMIAAKLESAEHPLEPRLPSLGPLLQEAAELLRAVTREKRVETTAGVERKIRDYQESLQRLAFEAAVSEERERRRIAFDLHDSIGQSLALAQIRLTSVEHTGEARVAVDAAIGLLEQAIAEARSLTFELSPPVLYDFGLGAALAWLAEDLEARVGQRVELFDDGEHKPLDEASSAVLFRAARELLLNVLKHAKAPAARVRYHRVEDHAQLWVEDDGVGFDAEKQASRSSRSGFGLFGVREQIRRLGGAVVVASTPGTGTRVLLQVPLSTEPTPT